MIKQIFSIVCIVIFLVGCSNKKNDALTQKTAESAEVDTTQIAQKQLNKNIDGGFESMRGKIITIIDELDCLNRYYDGSGRLIRGEYKNRQYVLELLNNKQRDTTIVVFAELIRINKVRKMRILDYLIVPDTANFHYYSGIELGEAMVGDSIDGEIFGIVGVNDEGDKPYFEDIEMAWRADRETEKIIKIETKGIKIQNEGYGI